MGAVMRLQAFGKVNYALAVRGIRDDGYHEVATVMQSISLADEVLLETIGGGFELAVEPEGVELGPLQENTSYRAWKLFCEAAGGEVPVRVRLRKEIPAGAGLGGASADAAAVLVGLNELCGLNLDSDALRRVGVRIGADVPFCISGGTALAEGVGERLTGLPAPPGHRLLLLKPQRGAETARVYRAYDERMSEPAETVAVEPVVEALRRGDLGALALSLGNDLAPVTGELIPEMVVHEKKLLESGALGAAMTGTGTAVYGVFAGEVEARAANSRLNAPFAGIYEPVSEGIEIL